MGYCIIQTDSDFRISSSNKAACLAAIKELQGRTDLMHGGHFAHGQKIESWWAFLNDTKIMEVETLEEAFVEWRFETVTDPVNGDITDIKFNGDKAGDERHLFNAIAPYVVNVSHITFAGEDDAKWMYYFDGNEVITRNLD